MPHIYCQLHSVSMWIAWEFVQSLNKYQYTVRVKNSFFLRFNDHLISVMFFVFFLFDVFAAAWKLIYVVLSSSLMSLSSYEQLCVWCTILYLIYYLDQLFHKNISHCTFDWRDIILSSCWFSSALTPVNGNKSPLMPFRSRGSIRLETLINIHSWISKQHE